ncbi:MAG: 3-oxoacyl-[acyl-carrier-protein] reductase [Candidatus Firestonebacteria bacterium]
MCEELLKDKVALITGSAQGIGKAIALGFAKEGATVVIADINLEKAAETSKEIELLGGKAMPVKLNVVSGADVEDVVNKILDNFKKIDILVNNAGITRDGFIVRMKEEDWNAVLDINLKGAFNCLKAVAKVMMKQRSGRIINMASIIGLMGNAGQANYAASKAGLIGLTKSAAKELAGRNINVNAIAPGFIATAMTDILSEDTKQAMLKVIPLSRFGTTEDVAKAALFLASDASSYLTGQVIQVDGGMVM